MTPKPSHENNQRTTELATAPANMRRARRGNRAWNAPASALLVSDAEQSESVEAQIESKPPAGLEKSRHFLIIDNRFGTPIHIFLELDPTLEPGFPGFGVRAVVLETLADPAEVGISAGVAIGRNPHQLDEFRTFGSDRAVAGEGFILIEPRYVGPSWPSYVLAFRPGGEKPSKRPNSDHHSGNGRR